MNISNKKIIFKGSGLVYGKYWGGGEGAYKASELHSDSKEKLLKEAKKMLKDGSLDSGMGYERLLGARIEIEKITSYMIDGQLFSSSEYETEIIGNLTEKQEDFLMFECDF
jgi:hypothetical protein